MIQTTKRSLKRKKKKKKNTTKSVHDPLNIARYLPKSAPLKKKCTHLLFLNLFVATKSLCLNLRKK